MITVIYGIGTLLAFCGLVAGVPSNMEGTTTIRLQ